MQAIQYKKKNFIMQAIQYEKKNFKVCRQCSIKRKTLKYKAIQRKRKTCRNQRKHGGVE